MNFLTAASIYHTMRFETSQINSAVSMTMQAKQYH